MTAVMTKPKARAKPAVDLLDDVLSSQATVAAPKAKADHPTVQTPQFEDKAKRFLENNRLAKSHAKLADIDKDDIRAGTADIFFDVCRKAGKADTSIYLQCGAVKLRYTVQNKYSAIDGNQVPRLRERFEEEFDLYFTRNREVTLKPDLSAALKAELIERLGPELVKKMFDINDTYTVSDAMHAELILNAAFRERCADLLADNTIKPQVPTVTLA